MWVLAGLGALKAVPSQPALSAGWSHGLGAQSRHDAIGALIADLALADAPGEAYLAQVPEEASIARLKAALFGAAFPADKNAVRARIVAAERDDFAAGRLVSLHGWLVSRTSARVCALAVLMKRGAAA